MATNPPPPPTSDTAPTALPNGESSKPVRSSSFNFLRRSKSSESSTIAKTTSAGRRLTRRKKSSKGEGTLPLRLPSHPDLPSISSSFNPSDPSTYSSRAGYPPNAYHNRYFFNKGAGAYTMDNSSQPDAFPRTESMTNRGRHSYASSAISNGVNSPRRVRRRKDPTPFNVLVIGAKNCGKTSFIEFLRTALARPLKQRLASSPSPPPPTNTSEQHGSFTSHYLETELEGERIGLTLYDSKGLERHLVDLQLREMANFLEDKFQETFNEEQKVFRAPGVTDTHIHCVFLILDPSRLDANIASSATTSSPLQFSRQNYSSKPRVIGGLDEDLDVDVFRKLQGKTTVIPIISKADTITTAHMAVLKRTVWDSLKKIKFDPLEAINADSDNESDYATAYEEDEDDDDDSSTYSNKPNGDSTPTSKGRSKFDTGASAAEKTSNSLLSPKTSALRHNEARFSTMSDNVDLPNLPFSVISPDMYEPGVIGRRFPWGFADPNNAEHCDFVKMKESVFSEWRADLRQASRERWYEGWRTTRLRRTGQPSSPDGLNNYKQRSVSGPTVSGAAVGRQTNGSMGQHRIVNISEIGVAT